MCCAGRGVGGIGVEIEVGVEVEAAAEAAIAAVVGVVWATLEGLLLRETP